MMRHANYAEAAKSGLGPSPTPQRIQPLNRDTCNTPDVQEMQFIKSIATGLEHLITVI